MTKIDVIDSENHSIIEYTRFKSDLIYLYYEPHMYFNEKSFTLRILENLFKVGYYKDIESFFKEVRST